MSDGVWESFYPNQSFSQSFILTSIAQKWDWFFWKLGLMSYTIKIFPKIISQINYVYY